MKISPPKIASSNKPSKVATRLSLLLFLFLFFVSPASLFAQSKEQLKLLVFDPVLLDSASGLEMEKPGFSQNTDTLIPQTQNTKEAADNNAGFSRQTISENIQKYNDQLDSIEIQGGPFSTDLYETLVDLARQYQQVQDHEKAVEIFDRAEYVSRINHGLFHPEQFASIEGLIESYLALNDIPSASEKQRYLLFLNEQYFGKNSLNSLPSLISLADHNMNNFNRVMNAPKQPTISFTSSSNSGFGSSPQTSPRQIAFGSLFQAQQNYSQAIISMIDKQQFFDPQLIELEYDFIETLFLRSFRASMIDEPDYYLSEKRYVTGSLIRNNFNRRFASGYFDGKNAFERLLIYTKNNSQNSDRQLISILLDYGDWHLLFGRTKNAKRKYQEANQLAMEISKNEPWAEQLMRPALPVHLPLISAKPNSRDKFGIRSEETLEHDGYIDIVFTISQYGRAKRLEIISSSENVTKRIERRLKRYLRNSPFRPRIIADGSTQTERVTMRYYYSFIGEII